MVDVRKKLHCDIVKEPPKSLKRMLETNIPYASDVELMGQRRAPLETYARKSKAAQAYRDLWEDLQARLAS